MNKIGANIDGMVQFVRTLQEHRNMKVSALAPIKSESWQEDWRDVDSEGTDSESDTEFEDLEKLRN